jgi:hypothetical protein
LHDREALFTEGHERYQLSYCSLATEQPEIEFADIDEAVDSVLTLRRRGGSEPYQCFRLNTALREHRKELTELEAVLLDIAQTLPKRFMQGTSVSFRQVIRTAFR